MSTNILVSTHTYDRTPNIQCNVYGYSIIRNMLMIIQKKRNMLMIIQNSDIMSLFSLQLFFKMWYPSFLYEKNNTKQESWNKENQKVSESHGWVNIDLIIKRHGWVRFTIKWVVNLHVNHMLKAISFKIKLHLRKLRQS